MSRKQYYKRIIPICQEIYEKIDKKLTVIYDRKRKNKGKFVKMINLVGDILFFISLAICVIVEVKGKKEFENKNKLLEKYANIIFLLIFFIATIAITYKVSNVPQGLHVDEAGAFYDAICISKYGVDRYLYKFPVYFVNFGGGQNALYTYLAAILIKIFGANTTIFRLPAILLSLLSMACLYKLICENNSKKQALFTSFILAICPFFVMKSRWGLESYLMCGSLTISMFIFMKALNKNKQYWYVLAGIFFGLTLYTYAIAYVVVPAILGIILLYLLITKKMKIKNIICMGIPLAILAIPLILMLAMNSGMIENVKLPLVSIPKLWFYRGGEISLRNVPENIHNIFEILFIKDFLNYNAIAEFGTLYKLSIPLVIFGLIEVIKNAIEEIKQRKFSLDFMMLVAFVAEFCVGLCIAELNINKINAIYIPMIYFAGRFLERVSSRAKYAWIVIIFMYCLNATMFIHYYFTEFAHTDLQYFEDEIIDVSKRAEELKKSKIYVENCLNQTYIYTLVATPISPYELNENLCVENGMVMEYGKYRFEIPQEIEEDAIYVIKNDEEKINELLEYGFNVEKYGEFNVLYFGE